MIKTTWKKDPKFHIWYLKLGKLYIGGVYKAFLSDGVRRWEWSVDIPESRSIVGVERTRRAAKKKLERAVRFGD